MVVLLAVVVVAVAAALSSCAAAGSVRRTGEAGRDRPDGLAVLRSWHGFTQFRSSRQSDAAATVVLVLDVSESMSRDDVEPTRMQAAKEAARVFLDEVPEELAVGLVTFGGVADVLAEPTADRSVVEEALVALPRTEGTVIGDGLNLAIDVVADRWLDAGDGPAAIVLLSDGRDTGSRTPPLTAAERAGREDIPVYTVVLGEDLEEGAGANTGLLAAIAQTTDGRSYTATTATGLIEVYRTIQEQLVVAFEITNFGAWFVIGAALLALAATFALLYALRSEMSAGAKSRRSRSACRAIGRDPGSRVRVAAEEDVDGRDCRADRLVQRVRDRGVHP